MKTPNWKEHTTKLLDWYETLIEQGNPKGEHGKALREQIIAVGELLDEAEKNIYDMAQEQREHLAALNRLKTLVTY